HSHTVTRRRYHPAHQPFGADNAPIRIHDLLGTTATSRCLNVGTRVEHLEESREIQIAADHLRNLTPRLETGAIFDAKLRHRDRNEAPCATDKDIGLSVCDTRGER